MKPSLVTSSSYTCLIPPDCLESDSINELTGNKEDSICLEKNLYNIRDRTSNVSLIWCEKKWKDYRGGGGGKIPEWQFKDLWFPVRIFPFVQPTPFYKSTVESTKELVLGAIATVVVHTHTPLQTGNPEFQERMHFNIHCVMLICLSIHPVNTFWTLTICYAFS